ALVELEAAHVAVRPEDAGHRRGLAEEGVVLRVRGHEELRPPGEGVAQLAGEPHGIAVRPRLDPLAVPEERGGEGHPPIADLGGRGKAPARPPGHAGPRPPLLVLEAVVELDRVALGELTAPAPREEREGAGVELGPSVAVEVGRALLAFAAVVV